MRVIITGITGLHKENIARMVAKKAARERGLSEDLDNPYTKRFIQVFSIEDEMKTRMFDLKPFLDNPVPRERNRLWSEALRRILEQAGTSEHAILCLHATYYRESKFFSCVDWHALLHSFKPTVIVNLINDVYDTWQTVNARERKLKSNSSFSLEEILAWRSAEFAATENMKLPHFMFAVKHPLETFYQLLFRRDLPIVYASFPITKPRIEKPNQGRKEVDDFRRALYESGSLTVLDPLTIDELRLVPKLPKTGQDEEEKPVLNKRWPLTFGEIMIEEVKPVRYLLKDYTDLQFSSLKNAIARHIELRDYQMVSQSDIVAAYRPYYGGPLGSGTPPPESPSGGVESELKFASIESKYLYVVHPLEDRKEGVGVFRGINVAVLTESVMELVRELRKFKNLFTVWRRTHGIPDTWE